MGQWYGLFAGARFRDRRAARPRGRERPGVRARAAVVPWRVTDTRARLESTTFTPFARLALAHAVGMAGDVFVTVSLAGSLFFDVGVGAARPKVLLYLLLTMAPFAVVAPVLGPVPRPHPRRPAPDGRGRRWPAAPSCAS